MNDVLLLAFGFLISLAAYALGYERGVLVGWNAGVRAGGQVGKQLREYMRKHYGDYGPTITLLGGPDVPIEDW
jgi:hypothetical protein